VVRRFLSSGYSKFANHLEHSWSSSEKPKDSGLENFILWFLRGGKIGGRGGLIVSSQLLR